MANIFYTTVIFWLVFLIAHFVFGTVLRYIDYKSTNEYYNYADLAILDLAVRNELIYLEPYYKIGLPIALFIDIIIWLIF